MTTKEAKELIEKIALLKVAFTEVEMAWDVESDILDTYYPFESDFGDVRARVCVWAEQVEQKLMTEVSWYERNKEIISEYFGVPDIQTSSADWCGCDVWTLDLKTDKNHELLVRQCLVIAKDDSEDVILTIRTDDPEGTSTFNDVLTIHEDEQQLIGLLQILTRHKSNGR